MSKKQIGLFFGSFNPVHIGHMIIANHVISHTSLDRIWMVVTPQNPLKERKSLANNYDRLHMVELGIGDNDNIRASNIEFNLPIPSYTIDTMAYLEEKYPDYGFSLIMGGDNLASLHKWKNYELLLERYNILVYKRPKYDLGKLKDHPSITILEAPLLDISASFIRQKIKEKKSIQYLVPNQVNEYLLDNPIYK